VPEPGLCPDQTYFCVALHIPHPLSGPACGLGQGGEYVEQHGGGFGLGRDLVLARSGVGDCTFFSEMTTFGGEC